MNGNSWCQWKKWSLNSVRKKNSYTSMWNFQSGRASLCGSIYCCSYWWLWWPTQTELAEGNVNPVLCTDSCRFSQSMFLCQCWIATLLFLSARRKTHGKPCGSFKWYKPKLILKGIVDVLFVSTHTVTYVYEANVFGNLKQKTTLLSH